MKKHFDVAVIGGGIVGLAHAWMAARRGLSVILIERSAAAEGASVRNFGMIWPIGQPSGELHSMALRSRDLWLELAASGAVEVESCGSLHLAHRQDEMAVLEEFCQLGTHDVSMVTAANCKDKSPIARQDNLLGGMWSASELRVDPRSASARVAQWLAASFDVACQFSTAATSIEDNIVHCAGGKNFQAERIIICSGSDLGTLYRDVLARSGLRLCKLQMLRSVKQPGLSRATAHIASGLTLRHYSSFAGCKSLPGLKARIARETPELDRYGIHVMASASSTGEVILGDSHEYGNDISPFDKSEIDDLILRELRRIIDLADWSIVERWHGIYAKHPQLPVFEESADSNVFVCVGTGGAGMTMSFGLAERSWNRWLGE